MLPKMAAQGLKVDLLLLKSTGSMFEIELAERGIGVFFSGSQNVYSVKQLSHISHFIRERDPGYDLVHTHLFPSQYWPALATLFGRINLPLFTTEHNTYNKRRRFPFLKYLERFIYDQYNRIICISPPVKQSLVTWVPKIENRTVIIPNGIDLSKFKEAEPYNPEFLIDGITADDKIIITVASLTEQKNHETLIKTIALLSSKYHLLCVGDGPLWGKLNNMVNILGIRKRVHFVGSRDDVEKLIKSADLFVLPSKWEGFGIAAIEAMAGGVPVIASNVPGLADLVNGAGILFDPENKDELAKKITEILENEAYYEELSDKCRARAENFSIDNTVDSYIHEYKTVVA